MKKHIFCMAIAGAVVFSSGRGVNAGEVKVIAKVNNEVITSKDFEEYLEAFLSRMSLEQKDYLAGSYKENLRKEALSRMIEDKLILAQAKKDKIKVPAPMIDDKFNKIVSVYSSLDDFEKSLADKGLNITALKEKIREQYLSRQIVDIYVKSQVRVAPQEISRYYRDHLNEFLQPPRYSVWIAKFNDYEYVKQIGKLIEKEGIAQAQKRYGDVLVKMEPGEEELRPEIASVLTQVRQGDYFIREIDGLVYLIFFEGMIAAETVSLETAKEAIYAKLWDGKMKVHFSEWIDKLKTKALIKIY